MASNFDRLARELRDKVYHNLCNTFLVELPAVSKFGYYVQSSYILAFKNPVHPELLSSQPLNIAKKDVFEDDKAPWLPTFRIQNKSRDPTPSTSSIDTQHTSTFRSLIQGSTAEQVGQKYSKLAPVSTVIPFLMTSTTIHSEATPIIYEGSTFVFPINSARKDPASNDAECRMKNIEIHLDLITAYLRNHSIHEEAYTFEFARRFISRFAIPGIERKTLLINIEYAEYNDFLFEQTFQEVLRQFTNFETLILKLVPTYMSKAYRHLYSDSEYARWPALFKVENQHILEIVREVSEGSLGPGLAEYERDDFYCLVRQ